jgi:cytochrome c556
MRKYAGVVPVVVLALGVWFLAVSQAREDAAKAAAADVLKLADAVSDPAAVKKLAKSIAEKYDDLGPIMRQMKAREKGGLGVGPTPGAVVPDAIELTLLQMGGRKGITAADLKANNADYQRIAEVVCGIAEVTPYYGPKLLKRPGQRRRWDAFANDMNEWGHELLTVVKANDATNLKQTAGRLNQSCNDCHTGFRDDAALGLVTQAANAVNNPAAFKKPAKELVRLFDLPDVSLAFEPRDKGGLGVGPKPGARIPDGIEAQLQALANAPPPAPQLAAQAPDLQRMAEVVRAVAEATPNYGKEYAVNDAAAKAWSGFSEDMKQGSDDLIAAIKGKDVKGLPKALDKLNQSCKDCHAKFR